MIKIKDIEFVCRELPQLIVALDEDGNYIHIRDVKEDTDYYCPCCGGIVRPRAFKDDRDYRVQSHFYHLSGGCSDESRAHWLYKNWLFKAGSQFYVDKKLYTVDNVDIEKSYNTSFGIYRPDITVILDNGKIMFFEINFTNSKTENDYFCKWNELNKDVIEVDIKKLMNEDFNCTIPSFSLVYSDGKCLKRKYQEKDDYANTIAQRKIEWKRQDKINYKIMWEKLDWFWIKLQDFKSNSETIEDLLESFEAISISDKEMCFDLFKRQSCIRKFNQKFRDIINEEIKKYFTEIKLQEIISSPVNIKKVLAIEKQGYSVNYSIDSILFNKKDYHDDLNSSTYSREWILRYSDIQKIILEIQDNVKICKTYEELQCKLYTDVFQILKSINDKYFENKGCIWQLDIPNSKNIEDIYHYNNLIKLEVGIKNSNHYNHCESFSLSTKEIDKKTNEEIYNFIIKKIEESMRKIYNYIKINDGIGCSYRHVFSNKEVSND